MAFSVQKVFLQALCPSPGQGFLLGGPPIDHFRGDLVSWQLTVTQSSEHFLNMFIEQQNCVSFVSLSMTRPVTGGWIVTPSPSCLPACMPHTPWHDRVPSH